MLNGGELQWLFDIDGKQRIYTDDPAVSIWTKLELDVLSPLAPDNLL